MITRSLIAAGSLMLLGSCARPDASGIYLAKSDREATLVQLVQTKDGALTGRLEDIRVAFDGSVKTTTTNLDGAASKHDLMFSPKSVWYGGLTATGTFTADKLSLTGSGFSLTAERASLSDYQNAVAQLQVVAARVRRDVANANAASANAQAQAQAIQQIDALRVRLETAAHKLQDDAKRLDAAVAASPEFGQRAAANTARIMKMVAVAPGLSELQRNQLIVQANQVAVGTNQIEVAREQYANSLNEIVRDADGIAQKSKPICATLDAAKLVQECAAAEGAMATFRDALARAKSGFGHYRQDVQNELGRQDAMIRQMGG